MSVVIDNPSYKLVNLVIDRVIPFWKILAQAGVEDFPHGESSCYCPFHDNTDTKAAKVYREDKGDRLWCYAEHKMYYPHDVARLGMIKQTPEQLFTRIWGQLPESVQYQLLSELEEPLDIMPDNWDEVKAKLSLYREGKSSYIEAVKSLLELSK